MKLAAALIVSFLGLSTAARADDGAYAGPPGAAPELGAPADYRPLPPPGPGPRMRPARGGGALHADIVARFDRDGDGRLSPQERRHAARALRRMARQLARADRRATRAERRGPGAPQVDVDVRW